MEFILQMFNRILFLVRKGILINEELKEKIKKIVGEREIFFIKFENFKKEDLEDIDLIITLGGDGTFIKAANMIEDTFILGINYYHRVSEGALTSLNFLEIEKLKEVFKGNFEVLIRQRAKVKLNGKALDLYATNEVYVGAESQFHSSRYKIGFNENKEEHRSSGIIISTGTGSPAWFYSAGGEIFDPSEEKLSFIVREPYFGKRVFKPTLLKGDIKKNEKIVIESTRDFGGILAINDITYEFNKGAIAEIELADKPLKVIIAI